MANSKEHETQNNPPKKQRSARPLHIRKSRLVLLLLVTIILTTLIAVAATLGFQHWCSGLDTVQLDGEGFEVEVASGDTVSVGDPLLTFDLEHIKSNAKSTVSPVIITNSDQAASVHIEDAQALVKGETKLADVTMS